MGNKAHKRRPVLKICSNCGKQFYYRGSHSSRNKNFFCCYECYIEFKTKRMKVKCDYCGTIFEKKRSDIKRSNHNFCSQECNLSFRHKQGEGTINHRVNGKVVHRRIAEEKIGRPLKPYEEVHHVDGNHFNNDPDNLMILSKSDHSKIHASWKGRCDNGRFIAEKPTS